MADDDKPNETEGPTIVNHAKGTDIRGRSAPGSDNGNSPDFTESEAAIEASGEVSETTDESFDERDMGDLNGGTDVEIDSPRAESAEASGAATDAAPEASGSTVEPTNGSVSDEQAHIADVGDGNGENSLDMVLEQIQEQTDVEITDVQSRLSDISEDGPNGVSPDSAEVPASQLFSDVDPEDIDGVITRLLKVNPQVGSSLQQLRTQMSC
jgi:hypothetical protein